MDISSIENEYSSSSQRVPSPDLFSSDDEESFQTEAVSKPSPSSASINLEAEKKDSMKELENARLQRLMSLLQGVPPPPSVTIPQITLNEVLQKLAENYVKLAESSSEEPVDSLWKPSSSLEEVKKTEWPLIKNVVYHDMHFNLCTASEEIEHTSMKLNERFIGAETSTWCNAVTSQQNSAKKRQRRSLGNASPGCRLSHLARRRQTFSSASIAQLSSVAGSGTAGGAPVPGSSLSVPRRRQLNGGSAGQRCIMVEIKKTDKNKRVKTNVKRGQSKIPAPESAPKPSSQPQVPVQGTKRALFQSPEEHKRAPSTLSQPSVTDNQVQRSKRALWPSDGESILNDNGKRTLDKSDSSNSQRAKMHCSDDRAPYSRLSRSLTFPVGNNSGTSKAMSSCNSQPNHPPDNCSNSAKSSARRASDQGPSDGSMKIELSELHKRKLFWAITSALRSHNISRNHQDFTRLSSMLAYHYIEVRSSLAGPPPASTSEHMLNVVSTKAAEVLQSEKAEKSENLGGSKVQKKEERSNRELFRDATASLNVRRSLCVSLTSANHQLSEDKPKATKRVPSARKSLSFDAIDPKAAGTVTEDHVENGEGKYQLDGKAKDSNWRGNGENFPLSSAKRVSRSLFLSPKDDVKTAKKDACEQTNTLENQSSSLTNNDSAEIVDNKSNENKKSSLSEVCDIDEKPPQAGSDMSSIPSLSAASSTLEADNEASRTSEATNISEQANSNDAQNHLVSDHNIPLRDSIAFGKTNASSSISSSTKTESANAETSDCMPTRVLRETKERILRACYPQPVRRTRKSLSLSKRELRSSSSDSVEHDNTPSKHYQEKATAPTVVAENCTSGVSTGASTMEPVVVLSPLKLPSPSVSAESNNTSKSTFGSPPFIAENTSPTHSPFLGFPPKDDLNSSGGAADGTDSTAKVPDGSSEEGTCAKLDMEVKVITPLLEAGVLESSVCVGSGSSQSTDADLTFRGRIESLKPSTSSENAINLDLGMKLSSNLLNMDENKEKSPVLEKWAERASRSAQKSSLELVAESANDATCDDSLCLLKPTENTVEESMVPWDESQMEAVSQCSTNVFEKFCSIFGPSSHEGSA